MAAGRRRNLLGPWISFSLFFCQVIARSAITVQIPSSASESPSDFFRCNPIMQTITIRATSSDGRGVYGFTLIATLSIAPPFDRSGRLPTQPSSGIDLQRQLRPDSRGGGALRSEYGASRGRRRRSTPLDGDVSHVEELVECDSQPSTGSPTLTINQTYTPRRTPMFRRWMLSVPPRLERNDRALLALNGWNDTNSKIMVGQGSLGQEALARPENHKARTDKSKKRTLASHA